MADPPKTIYSYYHAGPLFTLAELHTNTLLAGAIQTLSSGKFIPVLPQDLEPRDLSPHTIRDTDLNTLIACDLALFTYDGAELDAGTVVEYMFAKMADIPSVILRTDFRGAGDQTSHSGDPWNLMSSNWPRSVSVVVDSMESYKRNLGAGRNAGGGMMEEVARKVVDGFERVLKGEPRLPKESRASVYQWLALMPGFKNGKSKGSEGEKANIEGFQKMCEHKVAKGLL